MHNRAGHGEALFEAQRQFPRPHAEMGLQIERVNHVGLRIALLRARQPVSASKEVEVLAYGQITVQGEFLRHVADARARGG